MNTQNMHEKYMREAISLAEKGWGWSSPNPLVGAVVVKDGRIIGRGFHARYGEPHAERNALADCTESPRGADIYVTLEPCCHHGKQPPCTDALIEAGIKRVFMGSYDPNPLVSGKGISILKEHGIEVTEGILTKECDALNDIFFHFIRNKTPYVMMKYAMTMDGRIAACTGASKWITGERARENVQRIRGRYRGIMVGVGTVLADDPALTCRIPGMRSPVRIVCDSNLRTPLDSQLVSTSKDDPVIIATCCRDKSRHDPYIQKGCRIIVTDEKDKRTDLVQLMDILAEERIDSILLEGGSYLNWSAIKSGIVHKVQAYIAPKLLGGDVAKGPIGGDGFPDPGVAAFLKDPSITMIGDDILIESEVRRDVYGDN